MTQKLTLYIFAIFFTVVSFRAAGQQPAEVRVAAFGAVGDGVTDDSTAIQTALKSAAEGSSVIFDTGKTYIVRGMLVVTRRGVKLKGYGATVKFIVADEDIGGPSGKAQTSIQLLAPDTGVYGLTVTSNLDRRLGGHQNLCGIVLASERQEARDNRLEYIQVGIFARKARNFLIANNTVSRTFADGIHVTSGSWGGRITGNVVRETGDDMIAVVDYGAGTPKVGNVVIENNDVSGQYWGRGITVLGGRDITIRGNKISETTHGAGILITSDAHYNTADVINVLVEDNEISQVQTSQPRYNPIRVNKRTGHAAIHVEAPDKRTVRDVLIRNNTVIGSLKSGIFVGGDACQIGLSDNHLEQTGQAPIRINVKQTGGCNVACQGNVSASHPVAPSDCQGSLPAVPGAALEN